MTYIKTIDERISIIDTMDLGMHGRTSCYVLQDESIILFEPSASPSIPHIINGLAALNIPLEKIAFIIVTHIHLDHAGGAGLLLEKCTNAKLIVHPKGVRHMHDPSRLIAGAKAVYGETFNQLFDPIIPIPEDRIISKSHGEHLKISESCQLTFYDTPGHANHHFSIYDNVSNGIFTGDTIGILYRPLIEEGIEFYLPSTSPNQFNPEAMLTSAKLIESINVDKIYFSHFGVSDNPSKVISELKSWLPKFVQSAKNTLTAKSILTVEQQYKAVEEELKSLVYSYLNKRGISKKHRVYDMLSVDLQVCAMGLVDYFQKKKQI